MTEQLRKAIDLQKSAASSSALALKYLFALLGEGPRPTFMGQEESDESIRLVALINQKYSDTHYRAARSYLDEVRAATI